MLKIFMSNKFPLIEVSGDNYEIGYQMGKKLKKQISQTIKIPNNIAKAHEHFNINHFHNAAKRYLPYANKYFPEYIKELQGIADGSKQSFDDIWMLNTEEVLFDKYFDKCTTLIARNKKNILIAHNEGFDKKFLDNMIVVKTHIENGSSFLALTFAGMICGYSISINSHGITQLINSLDPKDVCVGIPKNFIARKALEMSSLKDIVNLQKIKERSSGYAYVFVKDNKVFSLETTAKKYDLFEVKDNYFVHANSYLSKLVKFSKPSPYSTKRVNHALGVFKKSPLIDESVLKNILSYRSKDVDICFHKSKHDDMTLASVLTVSGSNVLRISKGPACNNKYFEYSLY